MDQIEKIKTLILPVLKDFDVKLSEIKWTSEKNNRILQIAIMKSDGSMDIETCSEVSEKISELLDEQENELNDYFLEICSPGAEREIKDFNELPNLIGSHIYVRLKHPEKKMLEITGDLISIDNDEVSMNYRDKAVLRSVTFKQENIDFCRLAVKL